MKRLDDAREDLAKALALAPEDEQVKRLYARAKKAAGAGLQPTRLFVERFCARLCGLSFFERRFMACFVSVQRLADFGCANR